MVLHSVDALLLLRTVCLGSVAGVSPWVSAANGVGRLIQTVSFDLISVVFFFLKTSLTEKRFDSDQFPEQVQTNTVQTNIVVIEVGTRTRVLTLLLAFIPRTRSQLQRAWSYSLRGPLCFRESLCLSDIQTLSACGIINAVCQCSSVRSFFPCVCHGKEIYLPLAPGFLPASEIKKSHHSIGQQNINFKADRISRGLWEGLNDNHSLRKTLRILQACTL